MTELLEHAAVSRRFGADPRYVLLGGGNTSFKTADTLYIKPSGVALADIQPEQFVAMDRAAIRRVFSDPVPADPWAREAAVKDIMAAAVRPTGAGRPSVEAPLHEVMDATYVYHLHPAMVNGLTCAMDGEDACFRLFPEAMWIEYVDPGYTLATVVAKRLEACRKEGRPQPQVIVLQNHGVFVAAETLAEISVVYERIMATLTKAYAAAGVAVELPAAAAPDPEALLTAAPRLRTLLGSDERRAIVAASGAFPVAAGPLCPDYIVYAKSYALETATVTTAAVGEFQARRGYLPKVVSIPGRAVFAAESDLKAARGALAIARDAGLVQHLTQAFGGPKYLSDREREFIENWEVESYRKKIAAGDARPRRAQNLVCVVTGAAQGFGLGIAEGLAAEGGIVVLADLNEEGARRAAADLEAKFGSGRALAVVVNVADEESVARMVREITAQCGGIDLLVANAGVLRAGSVKTLSKKDWDLVTNVNYTGYFLCTKLASRVMAAQVVDGRGAWTNIVQVNSKSGLEGSNKNAAYAGSKFGTIGLTQSFAKELVEDRIKVNSVCPGNYYDGPLWSDPDNGLFVQYLRAGKVSGATSVEDVRRFYENQCPMRRGCRPDDIVRAILYTVEQGYETGQAIPVTGGQVMLR